MPSRPIFQPPRRRPPPDRRRRPARTFLPPGPHVALRYTDDDGGGIIIGGLDDTTFEHRQVNADVRVLVDFDNDGDFDHPLEDITAYVQDLETVTGRDWPSQLTGKAGPGRLQGTLTNTDNRFSYFNQASPLNTPPFSLQTGRRVRVCTVEAGNPDPVLLARDRFRRPDGPIGATENGLTWVNVNTGWEFAIQGEEAFATNSDGSTDKEHAALIDIGTNDYYVQFTHGRLQSGCYAGIYYRYQDANNYGLLFRDSLGGMHLQTVIAGVFTVTDLGEFGSIGNNTNGTTMGVRVNGTTATAYIEGVDIGSATAAPFANTRIGMAVYWINSLYYAPSIKRFDAWNQLPTETQGVLWTGDLEDLVPSVVPGPYKTAAITALGSLQTAATTDVSVEPSLNGYPTGIAVGHTLARADLLHPPGRIQQGDITTGPYGFDRQKALSVARQFEEAEFGFLREAQEGWLEFDTRSARDSSYPLVTFSDRPATQYAYETISPRDWRREIINQVQAGVAPGATLPDDVVNFSDNNNTSAGVANDVSVDLPAQGIGTGDLVIIFITSTVGYNVTSVSWLNPIWWVSLRTRNAGPGRQQVYAHIGRGDENNTSVLFYDDTSNAGGAWHAEGFIIPRNQWYGSLDGVAIADHTPGDNPPALPVPWGLHPSLFFVAHTGLVSLLGGSAFGSAARPQGYSNGVGTFINGASNQFDLAQEVYWRSDITSLEDPTTFDSGSNSGYSIVEACTLAVRGFNGNPLPTSDVVKVDLQDTDSQTAHGGSVKTHTGPDLFANKGQARWYADRVLGRYADDRPIFQIGFTATKSAAYRSQAIARRVNHRIRLQADEESHAGMGVDADYHIEQITNRFRDGCTNWKVAWELSPAENVIRVDTTASDLTSALASSPFGTSSTFQVTITAGPLWKLTADAPNMFPIRVKVGNEHIMVDEITGATSPQTFTGRRAFNGFTEAHSAGAALSLADPWVLP